MKKLALATVLLALLAARPAAAQEPTPPTARNAVYVELLGNGVLYSINYDRLIAPQVAARVGLMALAGVSDSTSAAVLAAPITISYLFGEGNNHFEAGLGVTLASGAVDDVGEIDDESFSGVVGTGTLGYRYQRPDGGFVFRAGLTPFFGAGGIGPWFGVSFGYAF